MKKYITIVCMALLASCSNIIEEEQLQPATGDWTPVVTRSGGASESAQYVVALRWGGYDHKGVLIVDGETSTWASEAPAWPEDVNEEVEVFAFDDGGEFGHMVQFLDDSKQYPYMMHYSKATAANKPDKFTMKHMMAQLKVNVLIREEQEHVPYNGKIKFRHVGDVRYSDNGDIYLDASEWPTTSKNIPAFTKVSATTQASGYHDDNFETAPFIVVPQTIEAGAECLTFWVEDVQYVFTPKTDLILQAGKVNVLQLGITYSDDDSTGGSFPKVELLEVSVLPWDVREIQGGEAEEELK